MASSIHQVSLATIMETEIFPAEAGLVVSLHDENDKWLASLTIGASAVTLAGPQRTFEEDTAEHSVIHSFWVRTLPEPFVGRVDVSWLKEALDADEALVPDILAIAMQYVHGAPPIHDGNMQIAGEAAYGPMKDGKRAEGSDFNDYLGLAWNYSEGLTDHPEREQFRCLDCSGFMRMIWGYRRSMDGYTYDGQIPLCFEPDPTRAAIPRRAHEIYESSPGVVVIENLGERPEDRSALNIGDLLFFDADKDDGPRLDHVGMYLGQDEGGHQRFISSRKTRNGPTLGDIAGASTLDGAELYARSFRCARRL